MTHPFVSWSLPRHRDWIEFRGLTRLEKSETLSLDFFYSGFNRVEGGNFYKIPLLGVGQDRGGLVWSRVPEQSNHVLIQQKENDLSSVEILDVFYLLNIRS